MALPPGPKLPRLLQTYLMFRHTDRLGRFCLKRYGPTFTLKVIPWGTTVTVTEAEAVKTVFTGDSETWHGGESFTMMGALIGKRSLILLEDPDHLELRKKLLPHFKGKFVRERYMETIEEVVRDEVARWPADIPFEIEGPMQSITLDVILRAIIGTHDAGRRKELREVVLGALALEPIGFLSWLYPPLVRFGRWRRWAEGVQRSRDLLREEIHEREAALARGERADDVLTHLIDVEIFDEEELIDQLMTLLFAGYETSSTALSWTFERLLRHPRALTRAREDEEYLTAAIKEALRLRPALPAVPRRLVAAAEVAGYRLPAGTTVMIGTRLLHLSPDLFEDPQSFRPERFLDGDRHAYDWVPFGGGKRRCLAASFALQEMTIVVRCVLENAELRPDRQEDEGIRTNYITFAPARGARVVRAASGAIASAA